MCKFGCEAYFLDLVRWETSVFIAVRQFILLVRSVLRVQCTAWLGRCPGPSVYKVIFLLPPAKSACEKKGQIGPRSLLFGPGSMENMCTNRSMTVYSVSTLSFTRPMRCMAGQVLYTISEWSHSLVKLRSNTGQGPLKSIPQIWSEKFQRWRFFKKNFLNRCQIWYTILISVRGCE